MSPHSAIRQVLLADDAIVALVADRIRPERLTEDDVLPAIGIEVESDNTLNTLDSVQGGQRILNVQVVAYSLSADQATTIAELCRDALDGVRNDHLAPAVFEGFDWETEPPEDDSDAAWYLVICNLHIFFLG